MASRPNPPCPHELRPGITVCLRCQHAERGVQRAKHRQMLARGGAAVLSLAVIVAVGVAAIAALRGRGESASDKPAARLDSAQADSVDSTSVAVDDTLGLPAAVAPMVAKGNLPAPIPEVATPAPAAPPLPVRTSSVAAAQPLVPVGRTALRDTMVADRAGDTVRVSFDLTLARTRRPDKFEAIVRSTLPQVYGALADSALRALPVGAVARAGDLIATLPETGFHIPIAGGRTIAVWPETRVGRDGPLVVAYRAVASR